MNRPPKANVQIDQRVCERLRAINDQLNGIHDRGQLSISNLISLVLDHWQAGSPPTREWLKGQANLYPADNTPRKLRG